ncbi:unnamed protein product [Urochloa decumbens]|uniref:F-box domain-containing protein n=1 Tax=Urochloa decumbens TaxID=240449 RepID=A0ABC9AUI0_9POAL
MEPAEATGTRARPRRRGGADGGYRPPDLLSALPDSLLHVIMSSLKARQAVQTCVLSTRWRDLWRSVPCLDIDLAEFRAAPASDRNGSGGDQAAHDADVEYMYDRTGSASSDDGSDVEMSDSDHESSSSEEEEEDMEMSGSDHESSGSEEDEEEEEDSSSSEEEEEESSSSSSSDGYSDDNGNDDDDDHDYDNKTKGREWEDFADFTTNLMSRCNIAQLDSFRLHIGRRSAPWSSSYRQATRWLHRAMKYCTPVATSNQRKGCLSSRSWRLRRLHLSRVHLDGRFAEHVTSVCRSLENLELHDCRCQIRSTLVIDGGSNYPNTCLLVVSAPVLEYLHLNVNVRLYRGGISLNGTPSSLSKASIHLHRHRDSEGMSKLGGDQLKLLCSVSNVTSLKLSGAGFLVLRYRPTFQEFRNLRNLVLANCDLWDDDLHILAFFLRSSPNLEKLTLRRCKFPKYSKKRLRKLKRKASSEFCGMDFDHENLNVEIIYKNGDAHQLGKIVKCALGNLSKSCIKLTKVS